MLLGKDICQMSDRRLDVYNGLYQPDGQRFSCWFQWELDPQPAALAKCIKDFDGDHKSSFFPRFELDVQGIFQVFPGSLHQPDGRRISVTEASALAVRPHIVGDI